MPIYTVTLRDKFDLTWEIQAPDAGQAAAAVLALFPTTRRATKERVLKEREEHAQRASVFVLTAEGGAQVVAAVTMA